MRLVELEMDWLAKLFRKDQTLCYFLNAHLQSLSAVGFLRKSYSTAGWEFQMGFFHELSGLARIIHEEVMSEQERGIYWLAFV
jgi:hypothetical protein